MKPCPYCGDCPPDGECGCIASEDVAALRAQNDSLKAAGRAARDDATSALDLLSRVRFALGDNGTRMQAELLEYCRELAALPGRVAELEALHRTYYNQPFAEACQRAASEERERIIAKVADWVGGDERRDDLILALRTDIG